MIYEWAAVLYENSSLPHENSLERSWVAELQILHLHVPLSEFRVKAQHGNVPAIVEEWAAIDQRNSSSRWQYSHEALLDSSTGVVIWMLGPGRQHWGDRPQWGRRRETGRRPRPISRPMWGGGEGGFLPDLLLWHSPIHLLKNSCVAIAFWQLLLENKISLSHMKHYWVKQLAMLKE